LKNLKIENSQNRKKAGGCFKRMVWKKVAEDVGSPLMHAVNYFLADAGFVALKKIGLKPVKDYSGVIQVENRRIKFCWDVEKTRQLSFQLLSCLKQPSVFERVKRESVESVEKLSRKARELRERDLSACSNEELKREFQLVFNAWLEANAWGCIHNFADFEHFTLSNKINGFLEERIREKRASVSVPEAFALLTTPLEKSPLALQDERFYELLALVQESPLALKVFTNSKNEVLKKLCTLPGVKEALEEHSREYDWLQFHYDGPVVLDESYFVELLKTELKQGTNGKKKLEELEEKQRELAVKQERLEKQLGLNEEEKHWIQVARSFMFFKALRKDVVFQASCWTDGLIKEIAARLKLTPLQARHCTPREVEDALAGEWKPDARELDERVKHSFWLFDCHGVQVFTGKQAGEFSTRIVEEEVKSDVGEVKGMPACVGKARGIVKIIVSASDMPKMREGDVLVSPATNPNILPAMKKAAAIVTDEGGITCHAAIVSRELGIPCVIGTKIATRVFKDGDVVEVDAARGIVKILEKLDSNQVKRQNKTN